MLSKGYRLRIGYWYLFFEGIREVCSARDTGCAEDTGIFSSKRKEKYAQQEIQEIKAAHRTLKAEHTSVFPSKKRYQYPMRRRNKSFAYFCYPFEEKIPVSLLGCSLVFLLGKNKRRRDGFEGKTKACEAFSVPSFTSHRK